MKFNCAYTDIVDINTLVENPRNPNKHPDKQVQMLAKIINYQGQRAPIVVSKRSGFITKGHCRLRALKELKWEKVAVDFQEYESEAQEYADIVADNKIAELADHDDSQMLDDIKDLNVQDMDFELLGLNDFSFLSADEHLAEKSEEVKEKKYKLEVSFPNEMEMMDLYNDLVSKGFIVRLT